MHNDHSLTRRLLILALGTMLLVLNAATATAGTQSIALDQVVSGEISVPGDEAVYMLDAVAPGTRVYAQRLATSNRFGLSWLLEDRFGRVVISNPNGLDDIGPATLMGGDYLLSVRARTMSATGTFEFIVHTVTDASRPLTPGQTETGTFASPGSRQTFQVDLSQRGTVRFFFGDLPNASSAGWRLIDALGNERQAWTASAPVATSAVALPAGTHLLELRGNNGYAGDWSVRAEVESQTVSPAVFDQPLVFSSDDAAQSAIFEWTQAAPTRLYPDFTLTTGGNFNGEWRLDRIDGYTVLDWQVSLADVSDPIALVAGAYRLSLRSKQASPVAGTLVLSDITDANGTMVADSPQTVSITSPGQAHRFSLSALAPGVYTLNSSGVSSIFDFRWSIEDSAGSVVLAPTTNVAAINDIALAGGDYTIIVHGNSDATGSFDVSLITETVVTSSVAYPSTIIDGVSAIGEARRYTFSVGSDALFRVDRPAVTNATGMSLSLHDVNGRAVIAPTPFLTDGEEAALVAGDYVLEVRGVGNGTGTYELDLLNLGPPSFSAGGTPVMLGDTVSGSAASGTPVSYLLTLSSPTRVYADLLQGAINLRWSLFDAAGEPLFNNALASSGTQDQGPFDLQAGTYMVELASSNTSSAPFEWRLVEAEVTSTPLTFDVPQSATPSGPGFEHAWDFTLASDQTVYFDLDQGAINLFWRLIDSAGRDRISRTAAINQGLGPVDLVAGAYTLIFDANGGIAPFYEFTAREPTISSSTLAFDGLETILADTLAQREDRAEYSLEVADGVDTLYIDITSGDLGLRGTLIDPAGRQVFSEATFTTNNNVGPIAVVEGTYSLVVRSASSTAESFSLRLAEPTVSTRPSLLDMDEVWSGYAAGDQLQVDLTVGGADPQDVHVEFQQSGPVLFSLEELDTGWRIVDEVAMNLPSVGVDRTFRLSPGNYQVQLDALQGTGPVSFRLHTAALKDAGSIVLNRVINDAIDTPGSRVQFDVAPMDDGQPLTFDMMADAPLNSTQNRWQLIDPVGQPVFGPVISGSSSADQGPTGLAAGVYTLLFDPLDSSAPGLVFRVAAPADPVTVPEGCAACSALDVVFAFDTSSSMAPVQEAMCDLAQDLVTEMAGLGIPIDARYWGLTEDGVASCLTSNVLAELGPDLPGSPPAGILPLDMCPNGVLGEENWATAAAVTAADYPWRFDAARLVVPIGDEGSYCGNDVDDLDLAAVLWGRQVAIDNSAVISPLIPDQAPDPVRAMAELLADGTGGFSTVVDFGSLDLLNTATRLAAGACNNQPSATAVPQLRDISPLPGSILPSGTPIVLSGRMIPVNAVRPLEDVTLNGESVGTIDATGTFFAEIELVPGPNLLTVAAIEGCGNTEFVIELNGAGNDADPWSNLSDASTRLAARFSQTTFDISNDRVLVELQAENLGPAIAGPILMAVGNDVDPGVDLLTADGVTPSGEAYAVVVPDGEILEDGALSASVSLSLGNSERRAIDFTPRWIVPANTAPYFTSIPPTRVTASSPWSYAPAAIDADGDNVTLSVLTGPPDLLLVDGVLQWTPIAAGNVDIVVRASDGRGGVARQSFTLQVADGTLNSPPRFITAPVLQVPTGATYTYSSMATDLDADPLAYAVRVGPAGMSVDSAGVVSWVNASGGQYSIELEADDGRGGVATQGWTLYVGQPAINPPGPAFATTPTTVAAVDVEYRYSYEIVSSAPGTPTVALVTAPAGMTLDSMAQTLAWVPQAGDLGLATVELQATDSVGQTAIQRFDIDVGTTLPNQPPYFASSPTDRALIGAAYEYPARAVDPEFEEVSYSLQAPPAGMTVDDTTGLVTWTPGAGTAANVSVTLVATDPQGAEAVQYVSIDVRPTNAAPVITAMPTTSLIVGEQYSAFFFASDADGDPVTWELAEGPSGMHIDAGIGWLTWDSTNSAGGAFPVEVMVSDEWGGTDTFAFIIDVMTDSTGPMVSIRSDRTPICVNETVNVCVDASDNVGIVSQSLILDAVPRTLDTAGCYAWLPDSVGLTASSAQAIDTSGLAGNASTSLSVVDCNDTQAPVVTLVSPTPGSNHDRPVPIIATIDDNTPASLTWEVTLRSVATGAEQPIGSGAGAIVSAQVARFDPSLLASGDYEIDILASDGVQTGGLQLPISSGTGVKQGRVAFALQDLIWPVGAFPLVISRAYDSLDAGPLAAGSGDFSPGWRLVLAGSVTDSAADAPADGGGFSIFANEPFTNQTRINVVKPDGDRVGFTFDPQPKSFPSVLQYDVEFRPDPGVTDTLRALDGPDTVFALGAGYADYVLPYNPSLYELETEAGMVYVFSESTGLTEVRDPTGGVLTVSDDGWSSTWGARVDYQRDAAGRITDIILIDTDGISELGRVTYAYDSAGNLVSATDLAGNTGRYEYGDPDLPHHVTATIGPDGLPAAQMVFDDDGRMIAQCPPTGDPVSLSGCSTFTFDVEGGVETLFDPRGFRSDLFYTADGLLSARHDYVDAVQFVSQTWTYDDAGREIEFEDRDGEVTRKTYNDDGYMIRQELPDGTAYRWEYGDCGDAWILQCDPLENCSTREFDTSCRVVRETDALGFSRNIEYGPDGLVSRIVDEEDQARSFEYGVGGRTTRFADAADRAVVLTYNALGQVLTRTDRDGATRSFSYDERYLLTEEFRSGQGVVASFAYDDVGRLTAQSNDESDLSVQYDIAGRVARVDHTALGGPAWWVEYDYDASDNLVQVRDSGGGVTDYVYDGINRLTSIRQSGSGVLDKRVDFEASGEGLPLMVRRYGDLNATIPGPTTEYVYGCNSCPQTLTSIIHRRPDGSLIEEIQLTRDGSGQIVAIDDADGAHSFVWDGRGWLVEENHPGASGIPSGTTSWDGAGNWLSRPGIPGPVELSYQSGTDHRLLSDGVHTYAYSNEGEWTERVTVSTGERLALGYTDQQRLESVLLVDGAGQTVSSANYGYALTGWRVRTERDGVVRHIVHDSDNPVIALDSAGNVVWRRLVTRQIDKPLAVERGGQIHWLLTDQLGSVRHEVDTQGQLLASFRYDPFGRQVSGPAPTLDDSLRFVGRDFDLPGGLGYFRARAYDPLTARFTSEDVLRPWHYRYADNNPLLYSDPTGLLTAAEYASLVCDIVGPAIQGSLVAVSIATTLAEVNKGLSGQAVNANIGADSGLIPSPDDNGIIEAAKISARLVLPCSTGSGI